MDSFLCAVTVLTVHSALVTEGDDRLRFPPGTSLPPHFVHWRPPVGDSYTISPKGHEDWLRLKPSWLNLTGLDGNAGGPGGQTFVGRRQVDTFFTYTVDVTYSPKAINEEAGITLFLTQNHHARFGITLLPSNSTKAPVPHFSFQAISYIPVPNPFAVPIPSDWIDKTLTLELKTVNSTHYSFSAGPVNDELRHFAYVPGDIVSWGFTGTLAGIYATSNGGNGTTPAYFRNWDYQAWGQVRDNPYNQSAPAHLSSSP